MRRPLFGSRAWVVQRLSAIYLFGFLTFVVISLWGSDAPWTYEAWRLWLSSSAVSVAVLLLFGALLLHTWVGMRDVILDYVHHAAARSLFLASLALSQVAIGAWVLVIVFSLP